MKKERVREMKESNLEWQGQVPNTWKKVYLKWYYDFEKGKNAALYTADYIGLNKGIFPVYSGQTENNGVMGNIDTYDYEIDECLFTTTVGAKVMTPRLLSGKFSLSQNCLIMKKKHQISNNFMFYLLICLFDYEKSLIPSYMQPSLRIEDLKKYQFFLPPIHEQKTIAEFLDRKCGDIDELVALQDKMIEELKAYKQSIITETVTKGLNPNVPLKDSGIEWIGEIPQHWEVKKLKYIVESIRKGNGITKDEVFSDGDISCVRYGEIYSKYNHGFKECFSFTKEKLHKSPCYFYKGDILCAGTGELVEEIGKSIVYLGEKQGLTGGDIILIRHNHVPSFLNYSLNSDLSQIQKSKGKAKLKVVHISASEIGNIVMPLPPIREQQEIADFLDKKCSEIDSLIDLKQQKIEELKDYKKSIIYEYVTGKKQVKSNEI